MGHPVVVADGAVDVPGSDDTYTPYERFTIEAAAVLRAADTQSIVNPSVYVQVPFAVELLAWDSVIDSGGGAPDPTLRGSGFGYLFEWTPTPQPQSVMPGPGGLPELTAASGDHSYTLTADGTEKTLGVELTFRVRESVGAGPLSMPVWIIGSGETCSGTLTSESALGFDDGDGIDESVCQLSYDFEVVSGPALGGELWVRSPNHTTSTGFPQHAESTSAHAPYSDCTGILSAAQQTIAGSSWSHYPCTTFGFPESPVTTAPPSGPFVAAAPNDDQIEYLFDIRNAGSTILTDYINYAVLPRAASGDSFDVYLTGPVIPSSFTGVTNAGSLIVQYSTADDPCMTEIGGSASCTNDWTAVFPAANPRDVTAVRLAFAPNMQLETLGRLLLRMPAVVAYDAQAGPGTAAWSGFTHAAAGLDATESVEAGVRVADRLSIGNRVWRDSDRDSFISGADDANPGIAGVTLGLYADTDNNGIPDGAALATDTTDADGYYLFDDLFAGTYIVVVEASNFSSGGPLSGLVSSPAAVAYPAVGLYDGADSGRNPVSPGDAVMSDRVTLDYGQALTGELDHGDDDGPFGRGTRGAPDESSTLAVDFGFTGGAYSIGDMLFQDDGYNGTTYDPALRNNGTRELNEPGVNGVEVALYRDGNGDGEAGTGEYIGSTWTTGGGAYSFTGLDRGDYILRIPASEFGPGRPLEGWHSSSFNAGIDVDHADKGVEPASRRPQASGIQSIVVTLDDTREVGLVDFGFVPPMAIGDRVWLDDSGDTAQWGPGGSRNNGLVDATDDGNLTLAGLQNPGIAGVELILFFDENNNGVIDGGDTNLGTTTSGTGGAYVFDGLGPGNYVVRVQPTAFGSGAPLNGLISSHDAVTQPNPANQVDNNDNGVDAPLPANTGVASRQIQLVYLTESTTDGGATALADDADGDRTIDFGFVRPPLSVGNRIWVDDHATIQSVRNNGILNTAEPGAANVEVALYRDLNTNGVVDAGEDTGLRDTTDSSGYYLFGNLPTGSYIVAVTAANFTTGGPLENMISSRSTAPNPAPADNQTDNNDNGIDTVVSGVGVISSRITLSYGTEPSGESGNPTGDGPQGAGTHGERDSDSDLTVDFGFFTPMSIGNRVWFDDSATPAHWAAYRDNATLDLTGDDLDNPNLAGVQGLGVANVALRLYSDLDADGVIDAGEDTGRTATTNATGYYLFDGLPRGNYIVAVDAWNFGSGGFLEGFVSSTDPAAPTDDSVDGTDDGIGSAPSPVYGIMSPSILLSSSSATSGSEPTGETDPNPQTQANRGVNGERDDFSNLTIDFGFVRPTVEFTGVVFDDDASADQADRANGIQDAGEPGIANVQVQLYLDLDGDGEIDAGEATGLFDVTDASGEFAFDAPVGDYVIGVMPGNFASGEVLEGTASSTGVDSAATSGDPVALGYFDAFGIGDTVWIDDSDDPTTWTTTRGNGELDPEDDLAEAAGVTLRLYADLDGDGQVDPGEDTGRTETTTAVGVYLFENVVRGDYLVAVEAANFGTGGALEGYLSSSDPAAPLGDGDDHGIGVAPDPTTGILSPPIELVSSDLSIDFGFVRDWEAYDVAGRVAFDSDLDGSLTAADDYIPGVPMQAGIPGVEVALWLDADANGTPDLASPYATETTGADGSYLFENVPSRYWIIRMADEASEAGGPLEHLTGPLGFGPFPVTDDIDDMDFLFALPATLSGEAWIDVDGDGVRGAGDLLAPDGTSVALFRDEGVEPTAPIAVTSTTGGDYTFTDLGAGDYFVSIQPPLGYEWVQGDLVGFTVATDGTDPSSASVDDIDFALVPLVAIGDTVWNDLDGDGLQESGEPGLANVRVRLLTATGSAATDVFGNAVADVWSDPSGRYLFTNLAPGDYRLGFDAPTGFGRTMAGAGATELDSDADPITGITDVVTVHGVVGGAVEASVGTFTYAFIDPTVDAGYERIVWDLGLAVDYDGIDLDASQITWQFAVDNAGPDAAPGPVVVTVELPEGLAFVSGGSTDVTCTAVEQTVTCIRADPIAAGEGIAFPLVTSYTGDPSGLTITAMVDWGDGDPLTANNEAVGVVSDGVIPPAPQPLPDVIARTGLAIAPYAAGGLGLVLAGAAVWFLRRRGARPARGCGSG